MSARCFQNRRPPRRNFPLGAGRAGARRGAAGRRPRRSSRPAWAQPSGRGGGGPGDAAGGRAEGRAAAAASAEPARALTAPAGGGAPAEGAVPPGPRGHLLAEPVGRHPRGPPPAVPGLAARLPEEARRPRRSALAGALPACPWWGGRRGCSRGLRSLRPPHHSHLPALPVSLDCSLGLSLL